MRLAKLKFTFQALGERIAAKDREIELEENHLQQLTTTAQSLAAQQQLTTETLASVQNIQEQTRNRLKALAEGRIQLFERREEVRFELVKAALRESLDYEGRLAKVNLRIRAEMKLPLDEARYIAAIERNNETIRTALEEFLTHVQEEVQSAGPGGSVP